MLSSEFEQVARDGKSLVENKSQQSGLGFDLHQLLPMNNLVAPRSILLI